MLIFVLGKHNALLQKIAVILVQVVIDGTVVSQSRVGANVSFAF